MFCGMISNIQKKAGDDTTAIKKCDFCSRFYDDSFGRALDNGSAVCPECVEYEDVKAKLSTDTVEPEKRR